MENCIRTFRKQRGLTQAELATALGVHEHSVIRWEKGYTTIPRDTLDRIACFFHVSPSDLVPTLVPDLIRVRTEEITTHA